MRKFSLRSLLTICIGLGAFVLVLVVFTDRPTALNSTGTKAATSFEVVDTERMLTPLGESILANATAPEVARTPKDQVVNESTNRLVTVKNGDSLSTIFARVGVPPADLLAIQKVSPEEWKNQYLDVGQKMEFQKSDHDVLLRFVFKVDRLTSYVFTRTGDQFTAEITEKKVVSKKTYRHVEIKRGQSVISAGLANGIKQEKTAWLLTRLLQWDIDFYHDIHPGDSYEILYFEKYVEGQYFEDGDIVAVVFKSGKTTHEIIRYRVTEDSFVKYYTRDGTSTEGQFLRAPLEYSRVSSEFSPRRLHPIHKRYMPHNGIDYAAPTGTPVHATGTGVVTAAGYKKLNGNYVVLKHGGVYQTKYLHLHKIDPKIKVGAKVTQGQRLGSVGMTGSATGPHLHYEFLVHGTHKNPRTVNLPRGERLKGPQLLKFEQNANEVFSLMATFKSVHQEQKSAEVVQQ